MVLNILPSFCLCYDVKLLNLFLMHLLFPPMYLSLSCCGNHPVLHFPVSLATMSGGGTFIGDQLILEEEYDENYIPSEQGT